MGQPGIMLYITEKLQNQSLEDVNFPAFLPKLPYQYHTRSKTRALQQTLQDALLPENGGTLLQGLSCSTPDESIFIFDQSSTTTTTTTTVSSTTTSSCSSTSCSIPVTSVEQFHNVLNETVSTTPPAPPKKRHCRSLSAGEVTEGRSRWKPHATKLWRPIRQCRAKVDAYRGHSPVLNASGFHHHHHNANLMDSASIIPSTVLNLAGDGADPMNQYSTPPESPVPRPASATSWENSTNPPVWIEQTSFKPLSSPRLWHRLRSLEDSEKEGLSASSGSIASATSSVDSAPESELTSSGGFARGTFKRAVMMPRCRSQPCVSSRKKCGKKRRREEEPRPNLDLFKMRQESLECLNHPSSTDKSKLDSKVEQTRPRRPGCHKYQNKKLLRSMGMASAYPPGLSTIASSPCENNNLPTPPAACLLSALSQQQQQPREWRSVMITPTSSPTKEMEGIAGGEKAIDDDDLNDNVCSYCSDDDHHGDDDDDDDDDSDADTMIERGAERFVLDPCNELDLEQIEKY